MSFSDSILPCNRGIPNNVSTRGLHKFVAGPYGTVCEYCGKSAESLAGMLRLGIDSPDGGDRQGQDER